MGVKVPEVGRWYRSATRLLFEVVAVDDQEGFIELQHFDGTIEEVDPEGWISMRAEKTAPPEDWSGSVDIPCEDIPGYHTSLHLNWMHELDSIDDDDLSGNDLTDFDEPH